MTFLLLHRDHDLSLLAQGCRVPARSVPHLHEAADLLADARQIRARAASDAALAKDAARAAGYAEGLADARADAEAQAGARLFQIELAAARQRRIDEERVRTMALAIVRRIAGELGDSMVVSAIAARAIAELSPETRAVVHVPPSGLARARAAIPDVFEVAADPALGPTDCIIETAVGRTLAGLETQLAAIARIWASSTEAVDAD